MNILINGYQICFPQFLKKSVFLAVFTIICFGLNAQSYDFSVTQAAIDDVSSGTTAPNGDFCSDGWGSMSADVSNAAFVCPDGSDNNTSLGMGINIVSV